MVSVSGGRAMVAVAGERAAWEPGGFVLRHALADTPTRRPAAHPLPCSSSTRTRPAWPRRPSHPFPSRTPCQHPLPRLIAFGVHGGLPRRRSTELCSPPPMLSTPSPLCLRHLTTPHPPLLPQPHPARSDATPQMARLARARPTCRCRPRAAPAPLAPTCCRPCHALLRIGPTIRSGTSPLDAGCACLGGQCRGCAAGAGRDPGCAVRHCGHVGEPAPGPLAPRGWPARPAGVGCRHGAPDAAARFYAARLELGDLLVQLTVPGGPGRWVLVVSHPLSPGSLERAGPAGLGFRATEPLGPDWSGLPAVRLRLEVIWASPATLAHPPQAHADLDQVCRPAVARQAVLVRWPPSCAGPCLGPLPFAGQCHQCHAGPGPVLH